MALTIDNLRVLEFHLLEMEDLMKALGLTALDDPALQPLIAQLTTHMDMFQREFYNMWGDL